MRQSEYTNKLLDLIGEKLSAMAHPLRLKIILALSEEPACVCELVERLGERQPLISQHLSILRASDLVTSKRIGNKIQYLLNDKRIVEIIETMKGIALERIEELSKI